MIMTAVYFIVNLRIIIVNCVGLFYTHKILADDILLHDVNRLVLLSV